MLGRKDELKNVNLENVLKVANELAKTRWSNCFAGS